MQFLILWTWLAGVVVSSLTCPPGCSCVLNEVTCQSSKTKWPSGVREIKIDYWDSEKEDLIGGTFSNLNGIAAIEIEHYKGTIHAGAFANLTGPHPADPQNNIFLEGHIIFRWAYIDTIKQGAFNNISNFESIEFHEHHIKYIEQYAFINVHDGHLIKLYQISIDVIKRHAFSGVHDVDILGLEDSSVLAVFNFAFEDVHDVILFDMYGTNVKECMGKYALAGMTQVRTKNYSRLQYPNGLELADSVPEEDHEFHDLVCVNGWTIPGKI